MTDKELKIIISEHHIDALLELLHEKCTKYKYVEDDLESRRWKRFLETVVEQLTEQTTKPL